MALLFMDGFDVGDTHLKWVQTGAITAFTNITGTRFGLGKALKMMEMSNYGGICSMLRSVTPSATLYVGAAVKVTWTNTNLYRPSSNLFGLLGDSGATGHLYVLRMLTGAVALYRGDPRSGNYQDPSGTQLASSVAGVMDDNWHYIEVSATINATTGHVVVKLDGTTVIDFTGNTKNGGTSTNIDAICFRTGRFNFDTDDEIDIDDLYVCNSTGAANNNFMGDVRVQTLTPSGAGSSTQFTPTGGANYANVAEVPDNTSTYNSSSTSGQRDTYAMADLASGTTAVYGIQDNLSAWKADAGVGNLKPSLKVGATVYYDSTISLGTSAAWYGAVRETNPATSVAWTPTDVNAIEFGAEVA